MTVFFKRALVVLLAALFFGSRPVNALRCLVCRQDNSCRTNVESVECLPPADTCFKREYQIDILPDGGLPIFVSCLEPSNSIREGVVLNGACKLIDAPEGNGLKASDCLCNSTDNCNRHALLDLSGIDDLGGGFDLSAGQVVKFMYPIIVISLIGVTFFGQIWSAR